MAIRMDSVVESVPQLKRGLVWCRKRKVQQAVDSRDCLRHGWPKCCGETMTIDSPEEGDRDE
jgi:hypothetical protein